MKNKLYIAAAGMVAVIIIITGIVMATGKTGKPDPTKEETTQAVTEVGSEAGTEDPQPQNETGAEGAEVMAENLGAANNDYSVSGLTYGIDVSKWQGKIDWKAVADAGIEFAMIRAGYRTDGNGTILEDDYARYNLQEAQKAGIKTGVYFFSTAVSKEEARQEASWLVSLIESYRITYPVVYNCEDFTDPDSRMYGLTRTERTDNAIAFLEQVKQQGYIPMFYASSGEMDNSSQWDTQKLSSRYKIWVAQYAGSSYSSGMKSTYSGSHAMWQYTNKGIVKGIKGYVDMNAAYFGFATETAPKKSAQTSEVSAPSVKVPETTAYDPYTVVNEQVTAKSETNLRTAPDSSDSGNVVYTLRNGEFVQRIASGSNGWSKVVHGGQTLYAISSLLTTSTMPTEPAIRDPFAGYKVTEVNEQVTAKEEVNLRTLPEAGGAGEVVYTLKNGEFVTRIAYAGDGLTTGWSRVIYGGQTLYALSSYLTK